MDSVYLPIVQYAGVSYENPYKNYQITGNTFPKNPIKPVIQFGPVPDKYKTKGIDSFQLILKRTQSFVADADYFSLHAINTEWSAKTVTMESLEYRYPFREPLNVGNVGIESSDPLPITIYGSSAGIYAVNAIKYGFEIFTAYDDRIYGPASSQPPELQVTFSDLPFPTATQSPQKGYVDEKKSQIFNWVFNPSELSVEKAVVTKSQFWWRLSEDSEIIKIDVGSEQTYTAPANTFPSQGSFQWRAYAEDQYGNGAVTPWRTISTTEALSTAEVVSPNEEVVDGSSPITLVWKHNISTGTAQTRADIQWGMEGEGSNDLAIVEGSADNYTVPANFFPAGELWWRVRTYNSDILPGEWAETGRFICVAAPPAPAVSVNPVPFAKIDWQAPTQQAYKVRIDSLDKVFFGPDKTYTLQTPLWDGEQRAYIYVQNDFGLWSPAGVAAFTVKNVPGLPIELSVKANHVAELSWNTQENYTKFLVYRDGKTIAETTELFYTDIYSVGSCTYQVLGVLSSGNYTESNSVNARICVPHSMICDVQTGQWLSMKLSKESSSEQTYSLSRTGNIRHYLGSKYPSVELSEFKDKTSDYTVAFKNKAEAAEFEALNGKTVCIKSRRDEITVGVLLELSKTVGDFYTAYEFSVRRIHWEGLD